MIISFSRVPLGLSHRPHFSVPFYPVTDTTNILDVFETLQFVCLWFLFLLSVKDQFMDQLLFSRAAAAAAATSPSRRRTPH